MPHAKTIPSYSPGAQASSPASPFSHVHPATPSANTPLNEQQTTSNEQSSALALFLQVLHIAMIVVSAIAQRMDSDLHCLTLLQGCEAINCLYSIIRIQLTIDRHPERITPDELRRLAKASRYINRLARRKLDFSPFTTTGSADVPSAPAPASQPASPSPDTPQSDNPQSKEEDPVGLRDRNPQSDNPQSASPCSALRPPRLTGLHSTPVCHSPGATLARTCQSLCRILKLLPDLAYDPSGTVPTLDLANPASFSPATLLPGARASSPASAPAHSGSPLQQDAVSGVRQPCCRFSSPGTLPLSPTPPSNSALSNITSIATAPT